jgi:hypothetical protein
VRFRLDGENVRLQSTGLEWLVVTPDRKVAVKGTGTLAGRDGGYGFVMYAYDADPDRYRIVVWSLDEGPIPGAELAYDNQPGASFDVDMANPQPISAGSVAVHS